MRLATLSLLTVVIMAMSVAVASAWHFNPITSVCTSLTTEGKYTYQITVSGGGFTSSAYVPYGVNTQWGKTTINQVKRADGSVIPADQIGGLKTTFGPYNNSSETFTYTVPADAVSYELKHGDQATKVSVTFNPNVPACQPPEPTPPTGPTPTTTLVVQKVTTPPVNRVNMHVSTKCVKRVGYKVFGTHITKVKWYVSGKYYKTTKGTHYIKHRSHRVKVKVYFEDGSIVTIPNRYDVRCASPNFTG